MDQNQTPEASSVDNIPAIAIFLSLLAGATLFMIFPDHVLSFLDRNRFLIVATALGLIGVLVYLGRWEKPLLITSFILSIPLYIASIAVIPLLWLFSHISIVFDKMSRPFFWMFDGFFRFASKVTDHPIITGDLQKIWDLNGIGPDQRPDLHRTDIPSDARRPLWSDGETTTRDCLSVLYDHHVDRNKLAHFFGFGVAVFIATSLALFAFIFLFGSSSTGLDRHAGGVHPGLPWMVPEHASSGGMIGYTLSSIYSTFDSVLDLLKLLAGPAGFALFATAITWQSYYRHKRHEFSVNTRDLGVQGQRGGMREVADRTYLKSVQLMTGYEKDSPILKLGVSTGFARQRGDLLGNQVGQAVAVDGHALFQHICVLGATGEGKTTFGFFRILDFTLQRGFGAFVMDAKGVLHKDVRIFAERAGRADDLRVIGPEPGQYSVDLFADMTPEEVTFLLSNSLNNSGSEAIWTDSGLSLFRAIATIARVYEVTPSGIAFTSKAKRRCYSFGWVYKALSDTEFLTRAVRDVALLIEALDDPRDIVDLDALIESIRQVEDAIIYAGDSKTQDSVRFTLKSWLSDLSTQADMISFAWAETSEDHPLIKITDVFNEKGNIICLAFNQTKYGIGAKLLVKFIKTAFFRESLNREIRIGSRACQARPVLLLIDEAQAIINAESDTSLSEITFLNVARSAGIACVIASQGISAMISGLGSRPGIGEHVQNILQNCRTKIFLRTECPATLEYISKLSGDQLVSSSGRGDATVESRIIRTNWKPMYQDPDFWPGTVNILALPLKFGRIIAHYFPFSRRTPFTRASEYSPKRGYCANIFGVDPLVHDHDMEALYESMAEYQGCMGFDKTQPRSDEVGKDANNRRLFEASDIESLGRSQACVIAQRGGRSQFELIEIEHMHDVS